MGLSHSKLALCSYRLNIYSETNFVLKKKQSVKNTYHRPLKIEFTPKPSPFFPFFFFFSSCINTDSCEFSMFEQKGVTCSVSDAFWNASPKIYFEEGDL